MCAFERRGEGMEFQMKNKKIGDLEAITVILLSVCLFIYEFIFCNCNMMVTKTYNFSLYRIVMYIIFAILYIKFSPKFIAEAEPLLKSKTKIIIVYLVIIIELTIIIGISQIANIFLVILAGINGLLFILYVTKDYIKNIIVTILTLGFVFSISTIVYHVVDEKRHFLEAFNVANGNFDFSNAVTNEQFNNIDFDTTATNFSIDYFGEKYDGILVDIPEDESVYSTPAGYNPIIYIPSAIGIFVAKTLGGSVADIFFAGRMANAIFYGLIMILIFKMLPFKKNVFWVMYFLPMSIVLAASYSADGATTAFVGLFIAYTLKLYNENKEKITFKQFIILLSLFVLCLLCKNGVYLGVSTIILIFPLTSHIDQFGEMCTHKVDANQIVIGFNTQIFHHMGQDNGIFIARRNGVIRLAVYLIIFVPVLKLNVVRLYVIGCQPQIEGCQFFLRIRNDTLGAKLVF